MCSLFSNSTLLYISYKKKHLLKPAEFFIINLAISDMSLTLSLYPMAITSSIYHRYCTHLFTLHSQALQISTTGTVQITVKLGSTQVWYCMQFYTPAKPNCADLVTYPLEPPGKDQVKRKCPSQHSAVGFSMKDHLQYCQATVEC
jgi:hypothetical protein